MLFYILHHSTLLLLLNNGFYINNFQKVIWYKLLDFILPSMLGLFIWVASDKQWLGDAGQDDQCRWGSWNSNDSMPIRILHIRCCQRTTAYRAHCPRLDLQGWFLDHCESSSQYLHAWRIETLKPEMKCEHIQKWQSNGNMTDKVNIKRVLTNLVESIKFFLDQYGY